MSANFSKKQTKISNITFNNLEALIGHWSSQIQENQNVFSLQCEELNKLMFGICSCQEKSRVLYEKMIIAKSLQDTVDRDLRFIRSRQEDIERMVTNLERSVYDRSLMCKCETPVDHYRENTYKVAESLNSTYLNFLEGIEELQTRTGQIKQKYDMDPSSIEYIAQLLQHHLQQLEYIEMKTYDLKNRLGQAEYYKQRVLASYKLKENRN